MCKMPLDSTVDNWKCGGNIHSNLILYICLCGPWRDSERNWAISVSQNPNVEACFLDLIEGNDPDRGEASSTT